MEFLYKSPEGKQKNAKIKRVVTVNKFNPASVHTIKTVVTSTESKSPPKSPTKSKPLGDTVSSHVAVVAANLPAPRWAPKPLRRKDIENKPWYEWSFEETTEYYMGDQIREDRYDSFNKSFVTKIPKQQSADQPHNNNNFFPKKKEVSATFGGKSPRNDNSSSASITLSAMALKNPSPVKRRGPPSVISSGTRSQQRDDTLSMSSYNTSRSVSHHNNNNKQSSAEEVAREVRQRHLRVSDLEAEIEAVKQQQASLISSTHRGQLQARRVAAVTQASDQALQSLEANSILALAQTKAAVSSLLKEQQRRENSVQAMLSEQTTALKRLSIRKSVRTSVAVNVSPPSPLLAVTGRRNSIGGGGRSLVPAPAPPPLLLPAPKITANNLDQYEQKLIAENRKSQVRVIIRRGLRRWALAFLAVRRKKTSGGTQPTIIQPTMKKSVRILTT